MVQYSDTGIFPPLNKANKYLWAEHNACMHGNKVIINFFFGMHSLNMVLPTDWFKG